MRSAFTPAVNPPNSAAARSQPGKGLKDNLQAPEYDSVRGKIDTNQPGKRYQAVGHWRNKR